MKRKLSIGKLLSVIGILILCVGLLCSGFEIISASSTVFRIIIAIGIITQAVALVFIIKKNEL